MIYENTNYNKSIPMQTILLSFSEQLPVRGTRVDCFTQLTQTHTAT